MDLTDLPRTTRDIVEAEVRADERILWVGQPRGGAGMIGGILVMLFSIPFTGFAIFWMCGVAGATQAGGGGPGSLFALFGLPFLLVGVGMFTAPFWVRRATALTAYVITDRRAICIDWKLRRAEISSYPAETLLRMKKVLATNGSGDLVFEERSQGSGRYRRIGFIGLGDVQAVERIIREGILRGGT